ncbi:MAG: DNA/RNA nuclease SfsA [Hyphomonadaceae bacterium]|nr:MAG: sugar fermentation stimulation protein A [Caulobacteraceae bacterium]MBT9445515.1 DNA/RNA nuclease SfsA [Hyphomonadaceae bacterium]TPW04203.1 MAG: sugar fermentation stimulation protein A [Alphaproteobacteria bacterium]
MRFSQPLVRATLLRRYKRFLADVLLEDGAEATAHVANSGKMLGLDAPGSPVWLATGTGKLPWSLKFVETETSWAGVDTHAPNKLVAEALAAGALPAFATYRHVRAEVKYGEASRVDFLLTDDAGRRLWLEIKNVHLCRTPGLAEFPDCEAARSARHMRELAAMVAEGDRAAALFVVQRSDCTRFVPAADLDPAFARAFAEARAAGVEIHAHACVMGPDAITLGAPVVA